MSMKHAESCFFLVFCCPLLSIVQECGPASRPSSQMSHAASSGYGSARSNNRTSTEAVTEESDVSTPLNVQQCRGRNSLLNSLRQSKLLDASPLFRSLRMPRVDPSPSSATAHPTCTNVPLHHCSNTIARIGIKEEEESMPVPAPRFHTLKRHAPHAYQNIPLPIREKPVERQAQNMQVRRIVMNALSFIFVNNIYE